MYVPSPASLGKGIETRFKVNPTYEKALALAGKMPVKEICAKFGIKERRLRAAATYRKISLAFDRHEGKTPWREEEIVTLRKMAQLHTAKETAKALGRTELSVKAKACAMGVKFKKYGEASPLAKYSNHDIELCRQLHEEGLRPFQIAQKMEIEISHLCKILKYESRYRELAKWDA